MKLNSKLLFWLVTIFAVVNIGDVVTAMFILPGETNPIYLLFNSTVLLWILKFFLIFMFYWVYFKNKYPTKFYLYAFIYTTILGIFLMGFGMYSNIIGMLNPQVVEVASELTTQVKLNYYFNMILLLAIIPYIMATLSFKIFQTIEKRVRIK